MGSPVIFPSLPSSGLLFDAKVVFERRFMQMATRPDYTSFLGVCQKDDPAGDRIIVIIDNPIGPMPEFTGTRHKAETNFDYWEQNVRTFASGHGVRRVGRAPRQRHAAQGADVHGRAGAPRRERGAALARRSSTRRSSPA
jgi:hypothetical protein